MPSHVAALWADNANLVRCRVVPHAQFSQPEFHVQLTNAIQSMPSMYDTPFESAVGKVSMRPNNAKLYNVHAWIDDTAVWFGDMQKNNEDWSHCPRTFLRRQEEKLRSEYKIQPTVGFELEFQLLERNVRGDYVPVDSTLYCEARAFHSTSKAWQVVKKIVECLQKDLGINVNQYHPESASGQFEISIGPFCTNGNHVTSLVEAIDLLVLTRQCIYGIAANFGLHATFIPKFRANEAGNAAHMHIGLLDLTDPKKSNLFTSQLTKAEAFVAGVLQELPAMVLLLAPSINSYDRLRPKCWAGAFHCYGYENREAPIRLISSKTNDLTQVERFEVKTLDATANPYAALAALLAAGMQGLKHDSKLPPACNQDPMTLPEDQTPNLLPQSLSEAIEAFRGRATVWEEILSNSYFKILVELREEENRYYGGLVQAEAIHQLIMRY